MKQLNLYYLGGGGGSVPDGRTVTPINDVTIWQQCAGISNPTYTTLAEILGDTGILQTLMADTNAVDYLARSKDFIGNTALVPIMTDNTHPSGEAIGIDVRSPYDFYKAFDGDNTTFFNPDSYPNNEWIGFDFGTQKYVNKVKFYSQDVLTYKIQYSDNKLTWEDATEIYSDATNLTWVEKTFTAHSARYWRLLGITNNGRMAMYTLQFAFDGICQSSDAMYYIGQNNYCANTLLADATWRSAIQNSAYFKSVYNVYNPIMTSNNTPSGVASSKDNYLTNPWKAMDGDDSTAPGTSNPFTTVTRGVIYEFDTPMCITLIESLVCTGGGGGYGASDNKVQYEISNDGVSWTTIYIDTEFSNRTTKRMIDCNSNTATCKYVAVTLIGNGVSWNCLVYESNYYGREDV